jgi:ribosomal-protein-alanine N-acetyltransferase
MAIGHTPGGLLEMRIQATKEIFLRPATASDAEFFELVENCGFTKQYLGGPSGHSAAEYGQFFQAPRRRPLDWLIVAHTDGYRLGRCGLFHVDSDSKTELQIVLLPEHCRAGVGTAIAIALIRLSDEQYPDLPVCAKVHPDNAAALRLLRKLKFVHSITIPDGRDAGFQWFVRRQRTD